MMGCMKRLYVLNVKSCGCFRIAVIGWSCEFFLSEEDDKQKKVCVPDYQHRQRDIHG